jgi:3-keto-5-aminohexanoate cleavage enzyme
MAAAAREAYNAGASIMHVHLRQQAPGMGHLPELGPGRRRRDRHAIREACPGVIINLTTGVVGTDISGPVACIRAVRPEIAACNAGSLNYLKIKDNGEWAWPPMLFDNQVDKVKDADVMAETGTRAEFECFDVGIVRSVGMYKKAGMTDHLEYNFVMGVASGMPVDADLLKLLVKYREPQHDLADHADWPRGNLARAPGHRTWAACCAPAWKTPSTCRAATRTTGNGQLIEALATVRAQRRPRGGEPRRGPRPVGSERQPCARRHGFARCS